MSRIANFVLGIAKSIANARNSTLRVRVKSDDAEYLFRPKDSAKEFWERHHGRVGIYLGESANPVKLDVTDVPEGKTVVDALEHSTTTKKYASFMQQEALQRLYSISNQRVERMQKLMYAVIAAQGIILILLLAQYGG